MLHNNCTEANRLRVTDIIYFTTARASSPRYSKAISKGCKTVSQNSNFTLHSDHLTFISAGPTQGQLILSFLILFSKMIFSRHKNLFEITILIVYLSHHQISWKTLKFSKESGIFRNTFVKLIYIVSWISSNQFFSFVCENHFFLD